MPGLRMGLRSLLRGGDDDARRRAGRRGSKELPFAPDHGTRPGEMKRTAMKFLLVAGLAVLLVLLWLLREILVLIFLAALIASAMYGLTAPLERRIPRLLAILVSYLAVLGVLALVLLFIVPPLIEEGADLVESLPEIAEQIEAEVTAIADTVGGAGAGERLIDTIIPQVTDGEAAEHVLRLPFTIVSVLVNAGIVLFLSALFLLERDAIRGWAMRFLVARDRAPALDLTREALTKLGAYIRGQLVVMIITGTGTAVGMLIFDVPFALPMGLLGFLAEAIPLAGPIIASVPVLVLAFLEGTDTFFFMLAWLVVLQQLEGWVIYPVVQGRILSLSPVVVVVAVLAGATLYGVLGAIIAVPIVAVLDVILRDVVFPLRSRASREDLEAAPT